MLALTIIMVLLAVCSGPIALAAPAMDSATMVSSPFLPSYGPMVLYPPTAEIKPIDFASQVLDAVKNIGGLNTLMKISLVIMLLVSSMKVSLLNSYVWSRLGAAKVWVAPALSLLAGVLGLGAGDTQVTPALIFAYLTAGGGAVFLHEILDSLKSIPKLGKIYVTAIDVVQKSLSPKS